MSRVDDSQEPVQVSGTVVRVTPKAVLFEIDEEEVWIPRSVINGGERQEFEVDDEIDFDVPTWFAEREGLC